MRLFCPLFLTGLLLLLHSTVVAQTQISNVRVRADGDSSVAVLYDLSGNSPDDSLYFRLYSLQNGKIEIDPRFVKGDWGRNVTPGPDRRIVWNVLASGRELDEELQATVLLFGKAPAPAGNVPEKPVTDGKPPATPAGKKPKIDHPRWPGGPGWALLSMVAPGTGNIFVQSPRPKVGARPAITVAFYGLLTYGLLQRRDSRSVYEEYLRQRNATAAQPFYDEANSAHQRYYIATRLATAIWATDVVTTFLRGVRNRKTPSLSVTPGVQAGAATAVVRYSF